MATFPVLTIAYESIPLNPLLTSVSTTSFLDLPWSYTADLPSLLSYIFSLFDDYGNLLSILYIKFTICTHCPIEFVHTSSYKIYLYSYVPDRRPFYFYSSLACITLDTSSINYNFVQNCLCMYPLLYFCLFIVRKPCCSWLNGYDVIWLLWVINSSFVIDLKIFWFSILKWTVSWSI